tara:strand:+ start:321 stop:452 length:132 start_codon:yes stop_codon:yes gene_type:complete
MTIKEAKDCIAEYESTDKHTMKLKLKYVKAKALLRNAALKINK